MNLSAANPPLTPPRRGTGQSVPHPSWKGLGVGSSTPCSRASENRPSMNCNSIYPCGRIARRKFLFQAGVGFVGTALGALWAEEGKIQETRLLPHRPPRARSVIFLFMCGGVSHIDTFDPKDNKWAGMLTEAVGFGDNNAAMQRPVIACRRTFRRHGQSGTPVSDWFPHVGSVIDENAVVRSM